MDSRLDPIQRKSRSQDMLDPTLLVTFILVVLGLFVIPGPAVLLTLARAISGGRRVGIATGLGIATGDLVHTLMATIGLSALLMTSALAFEIVKYLGVAYLVYLGISAFLEKSQGLSIPSARRVDAARAYRQAVLTEMLNPKTALFFLSFLPQFVRPESGSAVAQLAVLGLVFVAMSAAYTSLIAIGAGSFARWLDRHPGIGRWQGKVVGSIYLALGVSLALQER
jgi:threonine/homoserine/homoserine lactone efflux protein